MRQLYFANYVEKIKQTEIESKGQNMDKWKEEFIKEVYNDETVMMEIYDEIMKQVHAFWRNLRIILIPWKCDLPLYDCIAKHYRELDNIEW